MTESAGDVDGCTVYLMRHGDARPDSIRRFAGQVDWALNEVGRAQAAHWARELASVPFVRAYSSTLERAHEFAGIVCAGRRMPLDALPELCEISLGEWEGLSFDEVRTRFPREYARRGAAIADYRVPGGESFSGLAARAIPAFESIVRRTSGPVLIVGHAGVNRVILAHVLGMPLGNIFRLAQGLACLNVIQHSLDGWFVRSMNASPSWRLS